MINSEVMANSIHKFLQALMINQKQEVEEARKSLIEANSRNDDLMKKFEDVEKRAYQLQESNQRFVIILVKKMYLKSNFMFKLSCERTKI